MAGDQDDAQKTEEPTAKKLDDARKKGDIPKSQEVAGFVVLTAGAATLAGLGGPLSSSVATHMQGYLANAHLVDVRDLASRPFWSDLAGTVAMIVALPGFILVVAAIAGHLAQTGPILSAERLKPKLSKLSPMSGAKRVFGPAAAANFFKGIAKLTIVGGAVASVLWPRREDVMRIVGIDVSAILVLAQSTTISVLVAALSVYALLAAADYAGQRQAFMKRQRMSLQDIKDEHKQAEGDPQVRARLRQIRQERAQRRMITAVPDATVVVTNPTHFAVALRYTQGEEVAPICVAKGADAVALRIREVAEEHGVPIVEDPPLARALFAAADLDREIPTEHYQAVAKIIGYVLGLAQRRGRPKR